jgi:hypothetical protein
LTCRSCRLEALTEVLDLGALPEANSFPDARSDPADDPRFPLRVLVCRACWLVQLDDAGPAEAALPGPAAHELSPTMRAHAIGLVDDALSRAPAARAGGRVVEIASHGGHLAGFLDERGIGSLIVEGTPALAETAAARGHRVLGRQFGREVAADLVAEEGPADLVVDNYLLAHVADPDDVAAGITTLLAPEGRAVLEFDHVLPLMLDRRFDSIRHGHYSYLGLRSISALLNRHGLAVLDAIPQPVYGGALRIVVGHADAASPAASVADVLEAEERAGLAGLGAYEAFAGGVLERMAQLRGFLDERRAGGEVVVGYGAPSRGNTLLNASGVGADLLAYTVDRSPLKQGRRLPGSGIPIHEPRRILETRPAYVLILTWDLRDEVVAGLREVEDWGGRFVVPLPRFEVLGPG